MVEAGLLAVNELPELEERRRILNDALVVCNRAKSLIDALDAGIQAFQKDIATEASNPAGQKDLSANGIVSI